MDSVSASGRLIASGGVLAFTIFVVAAMPSFAAAQTVSRTVQLLPPGQNTCQAISVTNVTPYVYGGELESFDVTISDTSNSYVGVLAQVGNTAIPLNFITRWAGNPSGLRVHVDTPDIAVTGSLPVTLTLLASLPNQPTCAAIVAFNVTNTGVASAPAITAPVSNPVSTTIPTTPSAPVSSGSAATPAPTGGTGNGTGSHPSNPTTVVQSTSSTGTALAVGSVTAASNAKFLNAICAGGNAYRLWFILLVIYILIVGIVVFAEPWFLESSVLVSTAAILVPLILLLAFWYFSEACRAASWIPVIACVIAIVGLFLAFREYELPPLLPAPSEQ